MVKLKPKHGKKIKATSQQSDIKASTVLAWSVGITFVQASTRLKVQLGLG